MASIHNKRPGRFACWLGGVFQKWSWWLGDSYETWLTEYRGPEGGRYGGQIVGGYRMARRHVADLPEGRIVGILQERIAA